MDLGAILTGENLAFFKNIEDMKALAVNARAIILRSHAFYNNIIQNQEFSRPARGNEQHDDVHDSLRSSRECVKCGLEHAAQGFCIVEEILKAEKMQAESARKSAAALPKEYTLEEGKVPSFAQPPKPLEKAGKGPPTDKEKEWENLLYRKMTQEELDIEYSRICLVYGRAVGRKFLLARSMAQEPDQVQPLFTLESQQGTRKKKDNSRFKSITSDCAPGKKPDHPLLCDSISPDVRDKMASVLNKAILCEPESLREEKLWKNALKRKNGEEFFEMQEKAKDEESVSPSYSDLTSNTRSAWCHCGLDECECVKPACRPPDKNCPIEVDCINNYLLTVREKINNSRLGNKNLQTRHHSLAVSWTEQRLGTAPLDAFSKDPELMVEKNRILRQKELKNCLESKIGTGIADLDENVSKIAELCSVFTKPDDKNWDHWIEPVWAAENRSEVVDDDDDISDDSDFPTSCSNSMESSTTDEGITHQQTTARRIPFVKEPLKLVDVLFDKIHSKFRKLAMTSLNPQMTHPFKRRFFSLAEHPLLTLKCRNVIGDEVFTKLKLYVPHLRILKPRALHRAETLKRLERKKKAVSKTIRRRHFIEGIQLGKSYRRVKKPSKFSKDREDIGFKAGDPKLLEMPTPQRFTACGLADAGSDVLLSRQKIHYQYRLLKTLFYGTMKSEDRESLMDEGMKLRHLKFKKSLKNSSQSRIPTDTESEEGEDDRVKVSSISTRWPLKKNEKKLKSAPGNFPGGTKPKSNSHQLYSQLNEPKIFSEPYTTLHSSCKSSSKGIPTFSQSDQQDVPTRAHPGCSDNSSNQGDGYTFGSSLPGKTFRKASKYSSQKLSSSFLPQSDPVPARTISSQSYIYKGSSKAISLSHFDPLHLPTPPLSESSCSETDLDFNQHRVPPKEESHIERSARIVRREMQDGSTSNSQSLYHDKQNRRRIEDSELTDKSSDSYVPKLLKIPPKRISKGSASLIKNAEKTPSYHKAVRSRASVPYLSDSSSTDTAPTNPPRQKRRERLAWDHESGPHRTIAPYLDTQTRTTNSELSASGPKKANYESRKTHKGNTNLLSPFPKAGPSILKKSALPKPPSDGNCGNQSKTRFVGSVSPKPQPLSDSSYHTTSWPGEGLVRPARVVTERLLKAMPSSPDNSPVVGSGKRSRLSGTFGPAVLDISPSASKKATSVPRSSTSSRTKSKEESSPQIQEPTKLPTSSSPRQASLSQDAASDDMASASQPQGAELLSGSSSKRITKKLSKIASEAFRERALVTPSDQGKPQKRAGKKAADDFLTQQEQSNSSMKGKLKKSDALGPTRRICFNLDIGQGINCVNYLKENAPGSDEVKKKELVELLVTPVEVKKPPKKAVAKVEAESSLMNPANLVNLPDLESMSLTSEKSPARLPKTRTSKVDQELPVRKDSFKTLDQIYKEAHGINEKNTPKNLVERDYEHEAKKRQQLRKHLIFP